MPNFDIAYPKDSYVIVDARPNQSVQLELSDGECAIQVRLTLEERMRLAAMLVDTVSEET